MKTLKLIVIGIVVLLTGVAKAQVSVNINIGSPPQWGPVGYTEVRYYYLPDVEAYYDIQSSMFIYYGGGVWIHRSTLPEQYRAYDLYGGYKVVMTDYRGEEPYTNFHEYKRKYARGYHGGSQRTIGEKPEKGNSREKMQSKGHSDRKDGQGNYKSTGHDNGGQDSHGKDNNRKMEGGHGHGGGNGKRK